MSQSKGGRGPSGGAAAAAAKGSKGKKTGKQGAEEKSEEVLQAVIIADDFQSRFLPFSLDKPRCLLTLGNTPLIEHTLEFLDLNWVKEVYIYCGAHHEQIEDYIHHSRFSPRFYSCPFNTIEFIRVADARSVGDFLRDLDKRNIIRGDFLLVHGDLVSNLELEGALAAHKARREANRDSCMTMVLREAGEGDHHTKRQAVNPVFVVDPRQKRCLQYEEKNPFQRDTHIDVDPVVLENAEIEIRADLIDPQIDICTPDVLALWSESFDYELPRSNFLHGVLKDFELNGKMIHTEIVTEGYSARAMNLQMYDSISKDFLHNWVFPFRPDFNFLKDQTYRQEGGFNVFQEDDVVLEEDTKVVDAMLGQDTHVGSRSTIRSSIVGRNCKIGTDVHITDSIIWDDAVIEDGAVIDHVVIGSTVHVGKGASVQKGSLISNGVRIGEQSSIPSSSVLSVLGHEREPLATQTSIVGAEGRGAIFTYPEEDDRVRESLARLEDRLICDLDHLDLDDSSVSAFSDDDVSDDESDAASSTTNHHTTRSRLSSFASDDSVAPGSSSFHADAVHGILEFLRGSVGDFDSEKLEFTSLRLASNASDVATRKAVATAFVRRAVELMNSESGGLDAVKAAKDTLTSRKGASDFVSEVGVGGGSQENQVEFALAVQRACASSAKIVEVGKAGNLLAAMLQQMYDLDVLEEEALVAWWGDARGQEEEAMTSVRAKCQALIEWLENAEEESDEEDSEDDDDEDDDDADTEEDD
ncbi:eIF4-gamma/eIF5/eIF2-epsilon [Xylariaceae sp. FL0594]|nr:eIF4-gamma/eIF5/eIF2-epsilon [Xylariaceae sp. FL0594]